MTDLDKLIEAVEAGTDWISALSANALAPQQAVDACRAYGHEGQPGTAGSLDAALRLHEAQASSAPARRLNATRVHGNKHGYRGVEYDRDRNKYRAKIVPNGGRGIWLGRYDTPEEAAAAYDAAASEIYGDLAFLNFPLTGEKKTTKSQLADGLCANGHKIADHGYVRPDGRGVTCRRCNAQAQARYYARKKVRAADIIPQDDAPP